MTFDELTDHCTPEERMACAEYLALLRTREILKLGARKNPLQDKKK